MFINKDNHLTSKLNLFMFQLKNLPHNYKNVKKLRTSESLAFAYKLITE